ncbi:alpha/beta hydrolase [Sphingomonas sp. S-NIH.Pt15_0812]|jgi:pimeloyl-ACP methyl ester carboxylesterase|uniref:alpha/beta hydrolase n=1 Tax=Sphingomonas sp. S-NIH.Pt15_0812 TaxID=1920129 RepID=UPI000F7FAB98|nr:alpha/beta hydrolase [Sphingomonas sp. S-NIH.Pt15_0812]RSU51778.1 alpha/beta hydrolase [Sphingomonas sp. S-NIH.Pt15_0812]
MTDRPRLAFHHSPGQGPTILFLPGYASDMQGSKALALEAWARARGLAFLRFDYAGCGQSEGAFADQTLAGWRDDVLAMIDHAVEGPVVLVGSSMGGWLMLLAARARPDRVVGMLGIAAAPDFTDWGFTTEEKMTILQTGRLERANPYGPQPTLYTRAFWSSGEANRLMFGPIAFSGPVRLLHGQADPDVPFVRSIRLAELIASPDVHLTLVKDGDHRLSRDGDIALLIGTLAQMLGAIADAGEPVAA